MFSVGLLLAGVSAWAQSPVAPAAKLGVPATPAPALIVRAAAGDDFWDDAPQPAARLGPITGDVGKAPGDASDEEKFNWGTPRTPPAKTKPAGKSADRNRPPAELASRTKNSDDRDERSARLKEPNTGKLTSDSKETPPPGSWLEENTRGMRDGFMALGDRGQGHKPFESDKGFPDFVSPISNPMLAEDPRSLTELRPMYIYQTIPKNQYYFKGGNTQYFGLQGRLAFTERFSVVINKLGGSIFSPGSESGMSSNTGLSEIWLAPKFSFFRDVETQTIFAGGLQFQLPVGNGNVYQNTGGLSLVPYLSYGQQMWKTEIGTFSLMNVVGFSFGTSNRRSDYLYDTIQLSLDAADMHRIYPVVEMSWFRYTSNGQDRPDLRFEGRDLANIGSMAKGRNYLSIAPGVRFNITDSWQLGLTTEFPINGSKDLMQFRFGVDVIWRY